MYSSSDGSCFIGGEASGSFLAKVLVVRVDKASAAVSSLDG